MFDLDTMGRRARFTDVATILTGLADLTGQNERELFGRYLAELAQLTGLRYDENEAWPELRLTRAVRTFQALPWLATLTEPPDRRGYRADILRQLDDDLTG
jgi:Ser/Thr protein kinase RdoA (MazF antagonist)